MPLTSNPFSRWFSDTPRAFMASYLPLRTQELEHHQEDSEDAILLPSKHIISGPPTAVDHTSKWFTLAVMGLSVLTAACGCASYFAAANISERRDASGLRQPNQYPGLELVDELKPKGPSVYFPYSIVRVNKALPDQVYASGSRVILSDDDSMFLQWYMPRSKYTSCYIDSVVPTLEVGLEGNKTYIASGSLTQIQIWNVTTPATPIKSLSWNSRPERIALMGTVAFLPEKEKVEQLRLQDGWQSLMPTRFSCGEKVTVTIEVACKVCRLEFEQLFSFPPLAFDVMELG